MLWEGLDRPRLHRRAHQRLRGAARPRARVHAEGRGAQLCGIAEADLVQAARWFAGSTASARATLSLYCQGLNQSTSGTAKNAALINLHLATGQIGKPGAGPFSLTGQPNAMGGREVGGLANLLSRAPRPGQRRAPRRGGARCGACDDVPAAPGKTAVEMFEAAADGEIKALWIACTNPAQSMPDQATVRRALRARRVRRRAGGLRDHRHLRLRRPAAAGHHLGREGRHRHQQRAPHQPRARRRCRRPARRATTGPSPSTSRAGSKRGCARGRPTLFPYADAGVGLERTPRDARAAATSTSPA